MKITGNYSTHDDNNFKNLKIGSCFKLPPGYHNKDVNYNDTPMPTYVFMKVEYLSVYVNSVCLDDGKSYYISDMTAVISVNAELIISEV